MTETLPQGYSFLSTPRELSNEYQHDRVKMVFRNLCNLVLLMKVVASALKGLVCLIVVYTTLQLFQISYTERAVNLL